MCRHKHYSSGVPLSVVCAALVLLVDGRADAVSLFNLARTRSHDGGQS